MPLQRHGGVRNMASERKGTIMMSRYTRSESTQNGQNVCDKAIIIPRLRGAESDLGSTRSSAGSYAAQRRPFFLPPLLLLPLDQPLEPRFHHLLQPYQNVRV